MWNTRKQADYNLTQRFKKIARFLKKTRVTHDKNEKKSSLYRAPWYLVIGPNGSGKTSLLAKSELPFTLSKKFNLKNIPPTKTYDWWVTKDAVIIDTPPVFYSKKNRAQKIFLKLLKKHSYKKYLSGIVIVISINTLLKNSLKSRKKPSQRNLQQLIGAIIKKFSSDTPIFLIVNKCDLVTGFREFFSDLSHDERCQTWGFPVNREKYDKNAKKIDLISQELDRLVHQLNNQLIWRLQHERDIYKRALINGFPLQMIGIKSQLLRFIRQTFKDPKKQKMLAGIFFSSASQQDYTNQSIHESESHSRALIRIVKPKNQALFINELLNNFIFAPDSVFKTKPRFSTRKRYLRLGIYAGALTLIILCCGLWLSGFKKQINKINAAQNSVAAYHTLNTLHYAGKTTLALKLKSLTLLGQASNAIIQKKSSFNALLYPRIGKPKLRTKINNVYRDALHNLLLPLVTQRLTTALTNKKTSPDLLYSYLETYLMLENKNNKANANFIVSVMQKIWRTHYSKNIQIQLSKNLKNLLTRFPTSIKIDSTIVAQARNNLNNLPSDRLAYIVLLNNAPNNELLSFNLKDNKLAASVFTFAHANAAISSIYTMQSFSKIYPNLINKAAKEAIFGNWVIGENNLNETRSSSNLNKLKKDLSAIYLNEYAKAWLMILNDVQIIKFTNMPQLDNALKILSGGNSPLTQLVSLVQDNLPPEVTTQNTMLAAFSKLSVKDKIDSASLNNLNIALNKLYDYLKPTSTPSSTDQEAYQIAAARFQNPTQQDNPIKQLLLTSKLYPQPIYDWIYNLGTNAWQLTLNHAKTHINNVWQKQIFSFYQAQLKNHFPFQNNTNSVASLNNFSHFFAPSGLFDNFFTQYLKPFINTTQPHWKLKNIDGKTLQLPNNTLDNLEKVYRIQQTYFSRTTQRLQIPFIMKPMIIEPYIKSLTVMIGDQTVTFQNKPPFSEKRLLWPDDLNPNNVKVIFTLYSNRQIMLEKTGGWAWFKLLHAGNLQTINYPVKHYEIVFDKDGNAARVAVIPKHGTDPFSLKLLHNLTLPNQL